MLSPIISFFVLFSIYENEKIVLRYIFFEKTIEINAKYDKLYTMTILIVLIFIERSKL